MVKGFFGCRGSNWRFDEVNLDLGGTTRTLDKAAVKTFSAVSGCQPLLPRWALGNWWSRYYPYTSDEYLALIDKFQPEGRPFTRV